MTYYTVCDKCGAHLDPNEPCDCENEDNKEKDIFKFISINPKTGQLFFQYDKVEINQEGEQ